MLRDFFSGGAASNGPRTSCRTAGPEGYVFPGSCAKQLILGVSPHNALDWTFPREGTLGPDPLASPAATSPSASPAIPQHTVPTAPPAGNWGQPETTHTPGIGWRDAWQALLDAGACPKAASEAWVANHYRWIVWKLASHERMLMLKNSR